MYRLYWTVSSYFYEGKHLAPNNATRGRFVQKSIDEKRPALGGPKTTGGCLSHDDEALCIPPVANILHYLTVGHQL